jgi:hypothetical protein
MQYSYNFILFSREREIFLKKINFEKKNNFFFINNIKNKILLSTQIVIYMLKSVFITFVYLEKTIIKKLIF